MKKIPSIVVLLVTILLIPLAQQVFQPVGIYRLMGHYERADSPALNESTWFDKSFQAGFEAYMNENFGFRNIFVRLRNQIDWNLFRKANASDVLVGKNDFLFEKGYINAYLGRDYLGDSVVAEHVKRLRHLAAFFNEMKTPLLLVIAPGKARYYPELMPESVSHLRKVNPSNYERYIDGLKGSDVHYIDFNRYFIDQKDILGTMVFPKTGIHWSNYCAALALDSILGYAREEFSIAITPYEIKGLDGNPATAQRGDKDLENSMNLLNRIENDLYLYPKYVSETSARKPRTLFISDSFYYAMEDHLDQIFNNEFWYYYNKHWDDDLFPQKTRKEFEAYYRQYDLVIMMVTETGLGIFPWGLYEDMQSLYPDTLLSIN